jgi:hypothetical protein
VLLNHEGAEVRGLSDPGGGTFDAAGDFDRLLEDELWPPGAVIDPHGDTTLASTAVMDLLRCLPALESRARAEPEKRGLARLRVMAERCASSSGFLLKCEGD